MIEESDSRQRENGSSGNRMRKYTGLSFHRLPLYEPEILPLWLVVLQLDMQTPFVELKSRDYRVCGEHFDNDDFFPTTSETCRLRLKKNAVPRPVVMSSANLLFPSWFELGRLTDVMLAAMV